MSTVAVAVGAFVGVFVNVIVADRVLVGVEVGETVGVDLLVGVLVGVAVAARALKSLIWFRPRVAIMTRVTTMPRPTPIMMPIVCLLTVGITRRSPKKGC